MSLCVLSRCPLPTYHIIHLADTLLTELDGFQLLHAVHAVETFLTKLQDRGCIFNVLWFDNDADLCLPPEVREDPSLASKYWLARAVIIQHFACPNRDGEEHAAGFSYVFPSIRSSLFREYLDTHPLHFFLGSKANQEGRVRTPLLMLYLMSLAGYCVAFVEGIEFRSSKVRQPTPTQHFTLARSNQLVHCLQAYLPMTTPKGNTKWLPKANTSGELPMASLTLATGSMEKLATEDAAAQLTARELVSVCALAVVLSSTKQDNGSVDGPDQREAVAVLLQLVALRHCGLPNRSFPKREAEATEATNTPFLAKFFNAARHALTAWCGASFAGRKWDVFDLFDGRLYLNVVTKLSPGPLPQQIANELSHLLALLRRVSGVDIPDPQCLAGDHAPSANLKQHHSPQTPPLVLPFKHPVMDQYLADVRLKSDDILQPSLVSGQIFQELTHWHNARTPLDPKYIPKPEEPRVRKKHQRFMADTIAYSASLTGASGKNIEPETVVVQQPQGKAKTLPAVSQTAKDKQNFKGPKTKKDAPKSNKQKALEQGEARRLEKHAVVSQSVASAWRERCVEFEKQPSLLQRYLRAQKYFTALSRVHEQIVGAEVLLYLCDVLLKMHKSAEMPTSARKHPSPNLKTVQY